MPMTYNSLVSSIQAYCIRTDATFVSQIPTFIYNAEQAMCTEDENLGLQKFVTGNFIVGTCTYPKPARWRRNVTFNFGTANDLGQLVVVNTMLEAEYEFIRNYWPDPTKTAAPKFFSDYDFQHLLVGPTPDATYPFEFSYIELPEPITPVNQTNWITDYAPHVFLYACLLEAVPFLQNDERIPVWDKLYKERMALLKQQNERRVAAAKARA